MKRISVLIIGLALVFMVFAAAAEESFFEEGFLTDGALEESFFDEESFNGDEFIADDSLTADLDAEAEERSVIEIPNEDVTGEYEDWQAKPELFTAVSLKSNTVTFSWTHRVAKLGKNIKFYVYEVDSDGKGIQVGATTKKTLTIKNVPGGKHDYFVRLEYVDAKNEREQYGVKSEIQSVTISSDLWKKAPAVTAERTGENEVTLSWMPDSEAEKYEIKVYHGKTLDASEPIEVTDRDCKMTFKDTNAVVGKNTYVIHAVTRYSEHGKAAKKVVSIPSEIWKTAPVVRDFAQINARGGRVYFSHIATAEQYLIQVGKKKTPVSIELENLHFDSLTGWNYADVSIGGSGKQKVTVTPLAKSAKNKTVKGTKSAAYSVKLLKPAQLGAVNVKAYADGYNVTVEWENENPNTQGYAVYLFNDKGPIKKHPIQNPDEKKATIPVSEVGTYTVFVRVLTGIEDPLFDVENMECPTAVVVDGVRLEELKISLKENQTKAILYMDTLENNSTLTLEINEHPLRAVEWRSLDPTVATVANVDGKGVVTGLKAGVARIAVTAGYNTEVCAVTVNPVTYRALLIGNTYTWFNYLAGPKYDIDRMETMLKGLKGTPYQITKKHNLASTQFEATVEKAFAGADENDVSFFYYSGHGDEDGSLCGYLNKWDGIDGTVSPAQLRSYLDAVPGRKVIFSDSCYSGNLIGRGMRDDRSLMEMDVKKLADNESLKDESSVTTTVSQAAIEAANQAFIDAFKPKLQNRDGSNLADEEYYVITASTGEETSRDKMNSDEIKKKYVISLSNWYYDPEGLNLENGEYSKYSKKIKKGTLYYVDRVYYSGHGWWGDFYKITNKVYGSGAFTRSVLRGLGWDMAENYSKITACEMKADIGDRDRKVTLHELYSFVYDDLFEFLGSDSHKAQVYPENCGKVFFAN